MSSQPDSQLEPKADGELLGAYTLVSELTSGHLTSLYRARAAGADAQPKPQTAMLGGQTAARSHPGLLIKRLLSCHAQEPADRELLLAAGRAGLRVQSPHVVRVLAVHEDPEPFLVMEHIEGIPLSALLAQAPDREVLRYVLPILVDVLAGLQALHQLRDATGAAASLVHGAPSARHVIVGGDGLARLIDLTHASGPGFRVSARRSLRLHAAEMAPEQVLAPMHVDARCDLFIVGSVLWRALTGQPLFAHEDRSEALLQLLRKPILSPSEAGSSLGKHFDRICFRALARSRAERYVSAAEMARELRAEAERTGLYASREELGSFVRTFAPAAARSAGFAPGHAQVESQPGARADLPAAPAELPDVLTVHHQGSTNFGWGRLARDDPDEFWPKTAGLGAAADKDHSRSSTAAASAAAATEAIPSVATSTPEPGVWHDGLPSIFPEREASQSVAAFWLWGAAAASVLLGSLLIDNPPWRVEQPPTSPTRSVARAEQVGTRPAARTEDKEVARPVNNGASNTGFFTEPRSAMASSSLPPRGAVGLDAAAPGPSAPKPRALKRAPSPLPPNPY